MQVGRLYWKAVRDYLKQQQFYGVDVKWIESSGWLERDFTINGPRACLRDLSAWAKEIEADRATH
jgi:hypothetical protein